MRGMHSFMNSYLAFILNIPIAKTCQEDMLKLNGHVLTSFVRVYVSWWSKIRVENTVFNVKYF